MQQQYPIETVNKQYLKLLHISEIKNTKEHNAKDLVVAMPMFNLLEYSDKNPKASGMLWKCC